LSDDINPAALCREIIRGADRATLATMAVRGKAGTNGPWPYASQVLTTCDRQGNPLLLISDLADHTRNIRNDARVSLLYSGPAVDEPLGPRVSLQGEAEQLDKGPLLETYLQRHPSAKIYADFSDFHLFRVRPVRAHLVAGFGKAYWVEAARFMGTED
jgi:putative heme iron utilization protein